MRPSASSLVLACAAVLAAASPAAVASEGGGSIYPYGLNTVATGILPRPGHYLYNYNTLYTADVTTTNDGSAAPVPFDVEVRAHTLRYLGVLEQKAFGGNVAWLIAQPWLTGDAAIGPRADERSGLGDLTVGVMVGWHGPKAHQIAGVDVIAPTGAYDAARLFNPGRKQWGAILYYSVSAPLGERWDANLRLNLVVNDSNADTRYHSGTEFGAEYSVNYRLAPGLLVGVNGYAIEQLTSDELGGVPVNGHGRKFRTLAFGPQLVYRGNGWGAGLKWQHEAEARNKAEGDKVWLQLFKAL